MAAAGLLGRRARYLCVRNNRFDVRGIAQLAHVECPLAHGRIGE